MHKIVISVDWFQYFCFRPTLKEPPAFMTGSAVNHRGAHTDYTLKEAVEFSPIYRNHAAVDVKGRIFFHIAWCPKSSALNPNLCSVKVDNSLLYEPDWNFYLHDFIAAIGWRIGGVTRIDLCADFNDFSNGMKPSNFMRRYMSNATKKECTFLRCQSDKWCSVGKKTISGNDIDYIRWGSRTSEVCTYLYNKSKELREKKNKPWIMRQWIAADLDVKNVWRVEFSINSKGTNYYDWDKRVFRRLSGADMETQKSIEELFKMYCADYMHFKKYKVGETRSKREWEDYWPLEFDGEPRLKHRSVYRVQNSGRSERVLLNKLTQLKDSDGDLSPSDYNAIDGVIGVMSRMYNINRQQFMERNKLAMNILREIPFYSDLLKREQTHNLRPTYLQQMDEQGVKYRRAADSWFNRGGVSRLRFMLQNRQLCMRARDTLTAMLQDIV